jgi:hypothetical protein
MRSEEAPVKRCPWPADNPLMIRYHDEEWGVPVHDDRRHFEFLILEGAQAGLSWNTILQRREGYRAAFAEFDPERVARFTPRRVETLLRNPRIIRNRAKVSAAVKNARAFLALAEPAARDDARERRPEQGPQAPRLRLRRLDRHLRPHAGHGTGQRPPGDLLSVPGAGGRLGEGGGQR